MKKAFSVLLTMSVLLVGCTAKEEPVEEPVQEPAEEPAEEPAQEPEAAPEVPEELCGTWYEQIAGRGRLTITRSEDGTASAAIDWASSAFETNHWVMETLNYSPETATLDYTGGRLTRIKEGEEEVVYLDGAGSFDITEDALVWHDGYAEVPGDTTTFVREAVVGIPNPWKETDDIEEAEAIAGVVIHGPDYPPRELELVGYMAMPGTFSETFTNGTDTLVIRKSTVAQGQELSGDFNEYSTSWTQHIKGLAVECRGDGKTLNEGIFHVDDEYWALLFNPGEEGNGLTPDELNTIINCMQ